MLKSDNSSSVIVKWEHFAKIIENFNMKEGKWNFGFQCKAFTSCTLYITALCTHCKETNSNTIF